MNSTDSLIPIPHSTVLLSVKDILVNLNSTLQDTSILSALSHDIALTDCARMVLQQMMLSPQQQQHAIEYRT